MSAFSKGLRAFRDGLDRKLVWEYVRAIWDHSWDDFLGVRGLIGLVLYFSHTLLFSFSTVTWMRSWHG